VRTMENALWLIIKVPVWFFSAIAGPYEDIVLSSIPIIGTACLMLGIGIGAWKRKVTFLSFVAPFAASEVFLAVAGLLRGKIHNDVEVIVWSFLAITTLIIGFIVWKSKGDRLISIPLVIFSLCYAYFAAFVSGMAFTDVWL